MDIDTDFDFTTDSRAFWDGFWTHKGGLGHGNSDPDLESPTLRRYHSTLWHRPLPNGEMFDIMEWYGNDYIRYRDWHLGSDSITTGFRNGRCRRLIEEVQDSFDDPEDYYPWMESFIRRTYTIGGSIIFPKHKASMNQMRGTIRQISDRWDFTLECIRRYYAGECSPLMDCIRSDSWFFDLFVDFKGYVDFFLLQDCVSSDYSKVELWLDTELFAQDPFPKDVDEYMHWIDKSLDFVGRRNRRIKELAARMP